MPPLGVRLTVDVQAREGARGTTYYARVRWTHPVTHHREGVKRTHGSLEEAHAWVERLEGAARTGVDPGQPLADYVAQLGDRWARGIDPTSTLDPYSAEWDIDGIRPLRDYIDTKLRVQAPSCTALGYGMRSATATQLGVLVWWSPFIRIIANVALTSDIPVKEHGPDGPYGTQLRGALDDRLDLSSGDPEPEQPEDGLHDDDGCRDSSN